MLVLSNSRVPHSSRLYRDGWGGCPLATGPCPVRFDFDAARLAGRPAAVLLACTLVQLAVVLAQPGGLSDAHSTLRFSSGALLSIGALWHFLGGWSHVEACKAVGSPKLQGWRDLWWAGVEGASALYLAGTLLLSWKGGRAARLLVAAAMLSVAVSFKRGGVLDYDLMCGAGGRYFRSEERR